MSALERLLLRAWGRAFLLVQGGGVLLLALVVATEAADEPPAELWRRLRADVPHAWAILSPGLALAAAALATRRLRDSGELVALGTLGVARGRVLATVGWVAAPVALMAALVGRAAAPGVEAARVAGGWVVAGRVLPDPGGAVPDAAALATARFGGAWDWPGTGLLLVLGAYAGAALGLRGHSWGVLIAAAAWTLADVIRRGSAAPVAAGVLLLGAAAAALLSARSRGGP